MNIEKFYSRTNTHLNIKNKIYDDLNENFLNEEGFIPEKELKRLRYKDHNIKKDVLKFNSDVKLEIAKILKYDKETNTRKFVIWSGQDVLDFSDGEEDYSNLNSVIANLEKYDVFLWSELPGIKYF